MDLQKLKDDLLMQRGEVLRQLHMLDGAIQLCNQLIAGEGNTSPAESVTDGEKLSEYMAQENTSSS